MIQVGDKYKYYFKSDKGFIQKGESIWKNDTIDFRRVREGRAKYMDGENIAIVEEVSD